MCWGDLLDLDLTNLLLKHLHIKMYPTILQKPLRKQLMGRNTIMCVYQPQMFLKSFQEKLHLVNQHHNNMANLPGTFTFGDSYQVSAQSPFDSRSVVNTIADLTADDS